MEVLEAIQNRRMVRIPFNQRTVAEHDIDTLREVSKISPITGGRDSSMPAVSSTRNSEKEAHNGKREKKGSRLPRNTALQEM